MKNDRQIFIDGCKQLDIELNQEKLDRLDLYARLLAKWQGKFNLVGPDTVPYIYSRHILDSAQIAPYIISDDFILDIGSGAGLPAVVIAVLTEAKVVACECNGKKVQFLNEVRRKLGLDESFSVLQEDVYNLNPKHHTYSVITSRAFSALGSILKAGNPLLTKGGSYILHKGATVGEEINLLNQSFLMTADIKESITSIDGKILIIK